MSDDPDYDDLEYFVLLGRLAVSETALDRMRDFMIAVREVAPDSDYIAGFGWSTGRILSDPNGVETDLGPGIAIVAYERADVPPSAVIHADGLDYVIKIPEEIITQAGAHGIDLRETAVGRGVALV